LLDHANIVAKKRCQENSKTDDLLISTSYADAIAQVFDTSFWIENGRIAEIIPSNAGEKK